MFNSYVVDNVKDAAVDSAVEATGTQGLVNSYVNNSNQAHNQMRQVTRAARFMQNNFFS